jgi:FtsP/CotA-like multicopper oxidase with cupredoxin domain
MKPLYISLLVSSLASVVLGGVARFNLDLTWEIGAPDGVERWMVFVNKQFPGPTLHINQGDHVELTVYNHLPFGTTLHAHGIQ